MHECNAMQILETKEKKTKTKEQWSQRKSNEAQGPCQKDSVSLSLLHPKPFRCTTSIGVCIQLVTVWTNVSRLPTKMTHPSRLTMHLVLKKG